MNGESTVNGHSVNARWKIYCYIVFRQLLGENKLIKYMYSAVVVKVDNKTLSYPRS